MYEFCRLRMSPEPLRERPLRALWPDSSRERLHAVLIWPKCENAWGKGNLPYKSRLSPKIPRLAIIAVVILRRAVMILGIDLGTTNSSAGYMTPEGPRLVPNALGDPLTPSVVGIDLKGEVLVGQAAKDLQVTHPERWASAFKRRWGRVERRLGRDEFTPEELSSLVLRSLKQDSTRISESLWSTP